MANHSCHEAERSLAIELKGHFTICKLRHPYISMHFYFHFPSTLFWLVLLATFKIREGRFQPLDQCLAREYRISLVGITKQVSGDFCEVGTSQAIIPMEKNILHISFLSYCLFQCISPVGCPSDVGGQGLRPKGKKRKKNHSCSSIFPSNFLKASWWISLKMQWDPPTLEEVTKDMVDRYFTQLDEFEPELELPTALREPYMWCRFFPVSSGQMGIEKFCNFVFCFFINSSVRSRLRPRTIIHIIYEGLIVYFIFWIDYWMLRTNKFGCLLPNLGPIPFERCVYLSILGGVFGHTFCKTVSALKTRKIYLISYVFSFLIQKTRF